MIEMNSQQLAWAIRRDAIEMTHVSNGSHIASVLSIADLLAVLYTDVLHFDVHNPKWSQRDRVILSKGHAGAGFYAVLAESGFFPTEELKTHYADGSRLSGHVSHKNVPGVEVSTGSLGHGLPIGTGMALAAKIKHESFRVFVILGDGECDEGAIWEAALFAHQFKLNNLIAIVDHNKYQSMKTCEETLSLEPLEDKWKSFGWSVLRVNGHDHEDLKQALHNPQEKNERPLCVIADTIKGKGISFMENEILWHYRAPQGEFYDRAVAELEAVKP